MVAKVYPGSNYNGKGGGALKTRKTIRHLSGTQGGRGNEPGEKSGKDPQESEEAGTRNTGVPKKGVRKTRGVQIKAEYWENKE